MNLVATSILVAVAGLAPGQAPQPADDFRSSLIELERHYKSKNWTAALRVLDRQLKLTERDDNSQRRAGVLYNKACVHALANQKHEAIAALRAAIAAGRTDYLRYAGDADFESLRNDAEFKSILAALKEKHGPNPLPWDRSDDTPEFQHTFDHAQAPELVEMRREFSIDGVLSGSKDDYERLRRLTEWVSKQWQHSPTQSASRSDPLTILREARHGGRFICLNYAIVLAAAASAYGLPSRVVGMMPSDVETRNEAHSVTEVWLAQFEKWALADGQFGAVAELDSVPLNAVELQRAIAEEKPVKCNASAPLCEQWKRFIVPNMYYFKVSDDQRSYGAKVSRQLVLVPQGAPNPHKFAGGSEWIFANAIYVSNPDIFYRHPRDPKPARVGVSR